MNSNKNNSTDQQNHQNQPKEFNKNFPYLQNSSKNSSTKNLQNQNNTIISNADKDQYIDNLQYQIMENTKKNEKLHEKIIELFLNVKIRKQEDINISGKEDDEKEKEKIRNKDSFEIIDYIRQSVEILIDLKVKEKIDWRNNNPEEFKQMNLPLTDSELDEYEKLLRKYEGDLRNHIRVGELSNNI